MTALAQGVSEAVFQANGGAALLKEGLACEGRGTRERDSAVVPFVETGRREQRLRDSGTGGDPAWDEQFW